jgi:hypothetical protein
MDLIVSDILAILLEKSKSRVLNFFFIVPNFIWPAAPVLFDSTLKKKTLLACNMFFVPIELILLTNQPNS